MAPLVKLAVGVAGTALIANMAYRLVRSPLLSDLGSRSAEVMAANGITDGRANWVSDTGWTWRVARLSGTADAMTRRRTRDAVAALPGVANAGWEDEVSAGGGGAAPVNTVDIAACQAHIDALGTENAIDFGPNSATPAPAARAMLDGVAQILAKCPGVHVSIAVQTGTIGAAAVNMALSQARADALATALADRGVSAASLTATGNGEAGSADAGEARVNFALTRPKERAR
ncbi:MAG: OmpA family protein [Sandarakinorhabdus sp.]|nr:OmpA family protein [Sandarakinorhabdus sp.]